MNILMNISFISPPNFRPTLTDFSCINQVVFLTLIFSINQVIKANKVWLKKNKRKENKLKIEAAKPANESAHP